MILSMPSAIIDTISVHSILAILILSSAVALLRVLLLAVLIVFIASLILLLPLQRLLLDLSDTVLLIWIDHSLLLRLVIMTLTGLC